ncbi:MAG: energy transducer TonB [Gemmatimonadetes bacterium]|nr:energy transducer TonB [Gemmatimonadota bacterium]
MRYFFRSTGRSRGHTGLNPSLRGRIRPATARLSLLTLLVAACATAGTPERDNPGPALQPASGSTTANQGGGTREHTSFDVAPRLLNAKDVRRALDREYPVLLRDAGIEARVTVWILIDEEGKVAKTQVGESSSYEAFNAAALKVANIMKFSPALQRDRTVPVWVQQPIRFAMK